jgi:protein-S-isoprenylcysteine O-methyltransferase Ste14
MAAVEALSSSDVTKVGIIVIVALVLIGALLSIVITAIVGRIIVLVVVVALAVLVWQQRTHIKNQVNSHKCDLNATFFGIHLDAPDSVKAACRNHT